MNWISVKDRLPDKGFVVFIYYAKPNKDLGWAIAGYPYALAIYGRYGQSGPDEWMDPFDHDWLEEPDYWCSLEDIPKPGDNCCPEEEEEPCCDLGPLRGCSCFADEITAISGISEELVGSAPETEYAKEIMDTLRSSIKTITPPKMPGQK